MCGLEVPAGARHSPPRARGRFLSLQGAAMSMTDVCVCCLLGDAVQRITHVVHCAHECGPAAALAAMTGVAELGPGNRAVRPLRAAVRGAAYTPTLRSHAGAGRAGAGAGGCGRAVVEPRMAGVAGRARCSWTRQRRCGTANRDWVSRLLFLSKTVPSLAMMQAGGAGGARCGCCSR